MDIVELARMFPEATTEELEGVAAIQFLLNLDGGKTESPSISLHNWRNFRQWEKAQTLRVAKMFAPLGGERGN